MTLEFEKTLKALEEHIEILKQDLLFLMAECKPERKMTQSLQPKENWIKLYRKE
jgi:hypothetical protein